MKRSGAHLLLIAMLVTGASSQRGLCLLPLAVSTPQPTGACSR